MDAFHARRVFSSIDTGGRYAWGSQPDIGLWNLTRFAETLLPLLSQTQSDAITIAEGALHAFAARYHSQHAARFRAKLGLGPQTPVERIQACLDLLDAQDVDFTLFFRRLTSIAGGEDPAALAAMFADRESFETWFATWRRDADPGAHLTKMRAANPIRIPRNHRVEQAIQGAYRGDFAPFDRLVDGLATPYADQDAYADLETPPQPEEVVHQTFCGT